MTAGHARTPLARELGLEPGVRAWFHQMPAEVRAAIDPDGLTIEELSTPSPGLQAAHLFVADRAHLESELDALLTLIDRNGFIWVSWTDDSELDHDAVRDVAAPRGLAHAKSCELGGGWSGLKLVIDRERR